jgi:hypothetical protein
MTLAELIKQNAQAAADAGNWSAVATTVRALGLRAPSRKCGSVETAAALAVVGVNWAAVMEVIDDDATGRFILTMLAAEGVQWGHALTVPYLRSKQGAVLTAAGVDALIELSSPMLHLLLTASDCQSAMQADAAQAALETLRQRRQQWDVIAADIRSRIESGALTDNAAVLAAVQSALGV